MKAEKISQALGEIDEKYIEEAENYKRSKKSVIARQFLRVAACFALVLGILFSGRFAYYLAQAPTAFTMVNTHKKQSFGGAFGASKPSVPPTYWEKALYAKVYSKKGTYKPNESFELYFELGMTKNLGAGDLIIEIDGGDFATESSFGEIENGVLVIEDFTVESYSKEEPLCFKLVFTPEFAEEWASGRVQLSFGLAFDDVEEFIALAGEYMNQFPSSHPNWKENYLDGNFLSLTSANFDYACDGVELWVTDYGDILLEKMLMNHYNTLRINKRDFMRIYYEYLYSDNVFASVTQYMQEEKTFKFEYISKNIRYEKTEFISDEEIWALHEEIDAMTENFQRPPELAEKQMEMAHLLLEYMFETGVITRAEYEAELVWLSEVSTVGNMQAAYPGKIGDYANNFRKYIYTHKD
ncbi:MAG: hypothetical protein IJX55_03425 [Clostridia bacterium]|nr:hypothetical protein [Clostridia bacterium]